MVGITNFPVYQRNCRDWIYESLKSRKKIVVVKAPTGAGKTIILISFIEKCLDNLSGQVFIWLCPGAGNLEEQSRTSMEMKLPAAVTKDVSSVLTTGFQAGDTCFINWEKIDKKSNKAIREQEKKNLFERIIEAHRNNLKFVLIVDEEQSNDTSKAQDLINAFCPVKEIRVSATAKQRDGCDWYEVKESDVINAGFITKAIVINEGVDSDTIVNQDENEYLLTLALAKREEIYESYKMLGKDIKPLIIVQFPSNSDPLIESVEKFLSSKGYTYDNLCVAKWMSDKGQKINLSDPDGSWKIEDNNAFPFILLMKQAISTGWDCPRAKILVKLRTNMDEDFEIQTIGRIRRMPERKHYNDNLLDNCFLYTLDEKYVQSVKQSTNTAFQLKEVHLNDRCIGFELMKELKDTSAPTLNERTAEKAIFDYFTKKYDLGKFKDNLAQLRAGGYVFSNKIIRTFVKGSIAELDQLLDEDSLSSETIYYDQKALRSTFIMFNAVNHIGKSISLKYNETNIILRSLFLKSFLLKGRFQLIALSKEQLFNFVVNNERKLIDDFHEATAGLGAQAHLVFSPINVPFRIPEEEWISFDPTSSIKDLLEKNVYEGYGEDSITSAFRSKTERLFERYCNANENVSWYYKNGDSGIKYFSLVYITAIGNQRLFYPDYIVRMKNGCTWIIEAKGGESPDGTDQNIDEYAPAKFESLKRYCTSKGFGFGFVRSKDETLFINNTSWAEKMDGENWKPIRNIF